MENIINMVDNAILYDQIRFAARRQGKPCSPQQIDRLIQIQLQGDRQRQRRPLGGVIECVAANLRKELAVQLCLLVTLQRL